MYLQRWHGWCHKKLLPSVYTIQPCTMSLHAKPHTQGVCVFSCNLRHLRFWQNDRGLLRATAVTRGCNGYRNKSRHRKLTLEKKILPPPDSNPRPFDHESGALTTELSPLPNLHVVLCCSVQRLRVFTLQFIPPKSHKCSSHFRFGLLLASSNENIVRNSSVSLYKAFRLRMI